MLYPLTTAPLNLNLLTRTSALTYNLESCTRASRARHYRAGLATEQFLFLFIGHPPLRRTPLSDILLGFSVLLLGTHHLRCFIDIAWVIGRVTIFFPLSSLCYPLLL